MSERILCPKCNAVIVWNEQQSVKQCKLCVTKYKLHHKGIAKSALMPVVGRGQIDHLTATNERMTKNRPLIKSYILKYWKTECAFV